MSQLLGKRVRIISEPYAGYHFPAGFGIGVYCTITEVIARTDSMPIVRVSVNGDSRDSIALYYYNIKKDNFVTFKIVM